MESTTEAPVEARRFLPLDADRRTFLGASDVAAVLGLSRFRTPLQVYLQKRGELPETPTSPVMEWGNRLEDAVRQAYAEKVARLDGVEVMPGARIGRIVHPASDWMVCSPDGIVTEAELDGAWRWGLECKTADRAVAHLWGESGTDQVPEAYALQCHWSMFVTGLDRWDLAVLIGGNDWRHYTILRDAAIIDAILAVVIPFWDRVRAGDPPEPMAADNPLMARLFQQGREELIEGDAEVDTLARHLAAAKVGVAQAQERVDLLEAKLKARIGDRAGAIGPWGKILWKQNRDSERTDWKALALAMQPIPELIAEHTTPTQGARPFRATFTGGES